MGESNHCSFPLSSLLCSENESCLDETQQEDEEEEQRLYCIDDVGLSENDDEYIVMLISRERNHSSSESHQTFDDCSPDNWLRCAYLDAVHWILKMRAIFGFSLQTAYLSVTYLHRFLLCREIDNRKSWAIQLLSMACLSLAVKMEECKIPALSEFHLDNYNFEWKVIQRMELLVLNTLEWRLSSVTPFAYLHYFSTKLSNESRPPRALLSRAVRLILETTKELNLMRNRPSAIAAAAVLVSSDQRLTKDCKMHMISSCGFLEHENVFACYNQILELEKRNMKLPNVIISHDISAVCTSSIDVVDAASANSFSKRRRLSMNERNKDGNPSEQ